jgi:hypothetical protein
MKTKYHFTSDPGHGWLHVKRSELARLNLLDKVSSYSYQRGETVYLEEDCDASLFRQAKEAAGEEVQLVENYVERTAIRNYDRYQL